MTSLFQVIAHEDEDAVRATRRAAAAFSAAVENQFGVFFRTASGPNFDDRADYARSHLIGLAARIVNDYGGGDVNVMVDSAIASYRPTASEARTASFSKEAKPKMCTYHKDVVDISLTQGDPQAGFAALAPHWGGPRHCEGEGYEGGKCGFKPAMTTQSFWDDRKDKAERKRQERAERAQLDETQEFTEVDPDAAADSAPDDAPVQNESPADEGAEIIPFPTRDNAEGGSEAADVPMSMAAHTATFQSVQGTDSALDHRLATETTGLGGPEPKIDKRKWTPQNVEEVHPDDPNGAWPTVRKDIIEPIIDHGDSKLTEIGEKGRLERQDVAKETPVNKADGTSQWTGTEGQADPVTKSSADSLTPRCPNCNSATTGMIHEIGQAPKARCHACGNIWDTPEVVPERMSATDVNRNPIIDLIEGRDDGFVPDHVAHAAILAHKRQ